MCVPCVLQVSRAFTFKQVCQRSDQTLRLYFQDLDKSLTEKQNSTESILTTTGHVTDENGTELARNVNNEHRNALDQETFATNESISPTKLADETATSVLHDLQQSETFTVQYTSDNELDNNNLDKCLMIVSSELVEHIKLDETDTVDIDGTEMSFSSDNGLLENSIVSPVHSIHAIHQNTLTTVEPHELKRLTTTNSAERNADDLTRLPLDSDEIPADLLSETYGIVLSTKFIGIE